MRRGWVFLVPLGVLVYTLMIASWEAGKAGMAAVLAAFVVGALRREARLTPRSVLTTLEDTGRTMLDLVAITTLAGLVIGALQLSGFTFKLPLLLVGLAGGNALGLLALTAVVCIVLGMSLPTTVVYVTLAVLVGPALTQLGIAPLAAHLFLFYFGMLSLITPPDCLATYAAAAIARADFWKTGWTGMRLGIVAYVIPFVFAFHPALLFRGTVVEVLLALLTASAGVGLLAIGCAGYLARPLSWARRAWATLAGLLLIPPPSSGRWVVANLAGLCLGAALIWWERQARRPLGAVAAGAPPGSP